MSGARDEVAAWTDAEATEALRYAKEENDGALYLGKKGMKLAGARRLAKALRDNPELARGIKKLFLYNNDELGDAGLAAVAEGLAAVAALGGGEGGGIGGSGSGGGKFALELLFISNCGLKDLSVLLASPPSFFSSSSSSSSSSTSSASATVGAEASWLSGLKPLDAARNPLTEFSATLCGELTGLERLDLGVNQGTTLRLPAELWWLPKGCKIALWNCKGVQVARGPGMSGGFVDVPAKFTGYGEHVIHDMLAEMNIASVGIPAAAAAPVKPDAVP